MKTIKLTFWLRFAALALFAAPALAQELPFTGVVTADKVNVRSGPEARYYPVSQLNTGDTVKVRDNVNGFYVIDPPVGSFSYIAKQQVKAELDGKTGVVTEKNVKVRAPAVEGAAASFKPQLTLDTGAKVQIIGSDGDYYKIAPPAGVSLYIHQDFVKPAPAKAEPATQPKPAPKPEPKPETKPEPKPEVKPEAPKVIVVPKVEKPKAEPTEEPKPETKGTLTVSVKADGAIVIGDETLDSNAFIERLDQALAVNPDLRVELRGSKQARYEDVKAVMDVVTKAGVKNLEFVREEVAAQTPPAPPVTEPKIPTPGEPVKPEAPVSTPPRLEELELQFKDMSKKTIAEQPLAELRAEYEKLLAEPLSDNDKKVVKLRIAIIENRREIQMKLADLTGFKKEIDASKQQRAEIEAKKPKTYIAVGRLVTSTLYTGDRLPLLYRVVDTANGLTVAYTRPSPNQDHALLVGEYVGVIGEKEYDPSLKLNVIRAKEIDVLQPRSAE